MTKITNLKVCVTYLNDDNKEETFEIELKGEPYLDLKFQHDMDTEALYAYGASPVDHLITGEKLTLKAKVEYRPPKTSY